MVHELTLMDIEKEQRALGTFLDLYLPTDRYKKPRILNICSGIANEEPLLFQKYGTDIDLLSLDVSEYMVELSRELGRMSVKQGDLRELSDHATGRYDIVIGRNVPLNPQRGSLDDFEDFWPRVFEDLIDYMDPQSTLLLTLVRSDEHDRAMEILHSSEYNVVSLSLIHI